MVGRRAVRRTMTTTPACRFRSPVRKFSSSVSRNAKPSTSWRPQGSTGRTYIWAVTGRGSSQKYDYCDEAGGFLYQIVRYEPKCFKVRRRDGHGGWTWNLNGQRRVPYHLDELQEADRIVIVEGEKDADTGRELDFVATTNPHGAGKWRPEYNEHFRGKKVRIFPDADDTGLKHAQFVASQLLGIAESVKLVRLPAGKDLTEWRDNGGTREKLVQIMKATPLLTPAVVEQWRTSNLSKDGFRLTLLGDLLNEQKETIEHFHPHFLGFRAYFKLSEAVGDHLLDTAGVGAGKFIVGRLHETDPLQGLAHTLALLAHARAAWLTHQAVGEKDVRSLAVHLNGAERATNTYMQLMKAITEHQNAKTPNAKISIKQANVAQQQIVQNIGTGDKQPHDERTRIAPDIEEAVSPVAERAKFIEGRSPEKSTVGPEYRTENCRRKV
jgi:DNA primase